MTDTTPLTDTQLDEIEARATHERLTPGPWRLDRESCDCGGDYPCGHGMYVTGIVTPTPTWFAAERAKRTGEKPRDYDFHRSEVSDFTDADWELMAAARDDVPALVAEVRRLQHQRRYLIDQLAKKDAASGEADRKVREFLAGPDSEEPETAEPTRTLTESEYNRAWHAVEGAAGEAGADPGTVLHAVLDRLGIDLPAAPPVHACPPDGSGITPCCGRTPFELPRTDRMATDPALITCTEPAVSSG